MNDPLLQPRPLPSNCLFCQKVNMCQATICVTGQSLPTPDLTPVHFFTIHLQYYKPFADYIRVTGLRFSTGYFMSTPTALVKKVYNNHSVLTHLHNQLT